MPATQDISLTAGSLTVIPYDRNMASHKSWNLRPYEIQSDLETIGLRKPRSRPAPLPGKSMSDLLSAVQAQDVGHEKLRSAMPVLPLPRSEATPYARHDYSKGLTMDPSLYLPSPRIPLSAVPARLPSSLETDPRLIYKSYRPPDYGRQETLAEQRPGASKADAIVLDEELSAHMPRQHATEMRHEVSSTNGPQSPLSATRRYYMDHPPLYSSKNLDTPESPYGLDLTPHHFRHQPLQQAPHDDRPHQLPPARPPNLQLNNGSNRTAQQRAGIRDQRDAMNQLLDNLPHMGHSGTNEWMRQVKAARESLPIWQDSTAYLSQSGRGSGYPHQRPHPSISHKYPQQPDPNCWSGRGHDVSSQHHAQERLQEQMSPQANRHSHWHSQSQPNPTVQKQVYPPYRDQMQVTYDSPELTNKYSDFERDAGSREGRSRAIEGYSQPSHPTHKNWATAADRREMAPGIATYREPTSNYGISRI